MTPRPKNPPPDRRQEILDAALQVFAEKGFTAATNADIAKAAGVTSAAIYYYFSSKEELFKAAITERKGVLLPNLEQMSGALLDLPPQVVLPMFVQTMASFVSDARTQSVLRIIVSEGPRNPIVARIFHEEGIDIVSRFIMGYLSHQMELGTVRKMSPPLLSILVIGPIMSTMIVRDFIRVPMAAEIMNEELVRQITETVIPALLMEVPHKE